MIGIRIRTVVADELNFSAPDAVLPIKECSPSGE